MKLAILDYGLANLRSVHKAFTHLGHEAQIVSDPKAATSTDRLVLPGVGAVGDALANLRSGGLADVVAAHVEADRPMLGICLGLQMLFDICHEGGEHRGLGLLPGEVRRFDVDKTQGLKVPHMGWNTLKPRGDSPILKGLTSGAAVYFVHAYHATCSEPGDIAATTDYGGEFVSSVCRGNLVATQFHPEKSQAVGLSMLDAFARM